MEQLGSRSNWLRKVQHLARQSHCREYRFPRFQELLLNHLGERGSSRKVCPGAIATSVSRLVRLSSLWNRRPTDLRISSLRALVDWSTLLDPCGGYQATDIPTATRTMALLGHTGLLSV